MCTFTLCCSVLWFHRCVVQGILADLRLRGRSIKHCAIKLVWMFEAQVFKMANEMETNSTPLQVSLVKWGSLFIGCWTQMVFSRLIDLSLKNKGSYYFLSDCLIFRACASDLLESSLMECCWPNLCITENEIKRWRKTGRKQTRKGGSKSAVCSEGENRGTEDPPLLTISSADCVSHHCFNASLSGGTPCCPHTSPSTYHWHRWLSLR